jgi:hypothetical protein
VGLAKKKYVRFDDYERTYRAMDGLEMLGEPFKVQCTCVCVCVCVDTYI